MRHGRRKSDDPRVHFVHRRLRESGRSSDRFSDSDRPSSGSVLGASASTLPARLRGPHLSSRVQASSAARLLSPACLSSRGLRVGTGRGRWGVATPRAVKRLPYLSRSRLSTKLRGGESRATRETDRGRGTGTSTASRPRLTGSIRDSLRCSLSLLRAQDDSATPDLDHEGRGCATPDAATPALCPDANFTIAVSLPDARTRRARAPTAAAAASRRSSRTTTTTIKTESATLGSWRS